MASEMAGEDDFDVEPYILGCEVLDFAEDDADPDFQIIKCLEKVGHIRDWSVRRKDEYLFAKYITTHDEVSQSFHVEEKYHGVYDAMSLQVANIFSNLDTIGQIDLTVRLFSTPDMKCNHGEKILWEILKGGDDLKPEPFQSVAEPLMKRILLRLEWFPRGYWQLSIAITFLVLWHVAEACPIVAANALWSFKVNARKAGNQYAENHFSDNMQTLISKYNLDQEISCDESDDCDCGSCQLYYAHTLAIEVLEGDDPNEYRRAEENLATTLSNVRGFHDAKLKAQETLAKVRKERIKFDRWLTCHRKVKEEQERCEREQRRREACATRERERQRKAREYEASKAHELAIASAAARVARGAVGAVLDAARRADRARASEEHARLANLRAINAALGQKDAAAVQRTLERKKQVTHSKPQTKKPQVNSSFKPHSKSKPKPRVYSNTRSTSQDTQDNTPKPQPKKPQASQPSKPQVGPILNSSAKTPQRIAEKEEHKRHRRLLCVWAAALLTRIARGCLARRAFKRMLDAKCTPPNAPLTQSSLVECSVCLEAMDSPIAFGCGHIFCSTCSKKAVHKCFFCQQPILMRIKLFV